MSCDAICISLICWNSTWLLTITMKTTSAANHASVLSLLEQGYSVRDIERRTGVGKSTEGRIKKRWMQRRKTILVDVLPSFLPWLMTKHPLFIKFNQGSWILLFRLPISLILLFNILSTPKQSEGHFRRVVSGLLQRRKCPCWRRFIIRRGWSLHNDMETGQ